MPAQTSKPNYIHSETFFDSDRWGAHEKVGELMAQGISQITIAFAHGEWTVSWPMQRAANPLALPDPRP